MFPVHARVCGSKRAAFPDAFTHRQFVVESFDLDDQAVLTGHQFVLQLGHLSLVGRLCQVVAEDVDQQVKQDHTGGERKEVSGIKRGGGEDGW